MTFQPFIGLELKGLEAGVLREDAFALGPQESHWPVKSPASGSGLSGSLPRTSRWLSLGPHAVTEHLQAIASGKLEVYEATAFSNLEESKDRTLAMSAGDTFLAEAAVLQNAEAVLAQDRRLPCSIVTYGAAVAASKAAPWRIVLELLKQLEASLCECNTITYNAAIIACAEGGERGKAWQLFEKFKASRLEYDAITYTAALAASGSWETALSLTSDAAHSSHLDLVTCSAAINACERAARWRQALDVLCTALAASLQCDSVAYDSAIVACKVAQTCGFANSERLAAACSTLKLAGKTTLARALSKRTGAVYISVASVLGDLIAPGALPCKLSKDVAKALRSGKEVPIDLVIAALQQRLISADCLRSGWILDDFPCTAAQAEALTHAGIVPHRVLLLGATEATIFTRTLALNATSGEDAGALVQQELGLQKERMCSFQDSSSALRVFYALTFENLRDIDGARRAAE
ncbi:ak8 [Symbiodinium natans]|uniref:Ak8 protein n=1 Tax=Symbiodinium natans TaxID=878477 RepID=A0A812MJH7_9DINO|nr:ak8 [Symbiodinium natans]